jgi:hypothetical protein
LISSEIPWITSRKEADRDHQANRPDGEAAGVARLLVGFVGEDKDRPRHVHDGDSHRHQEENDAEDVDHRLAPPGEATSDKIDTHMLVAHQRVTGAKQENRREQVPLNLEKGVRAVVDGVTHDCVTGTDQGDDQHQPDDALADAFGEAINQA